MGRAPCCDKSKVKRGPWSPEEDATLKNYLEKNGTGGNWIALPQKAGLLACFFFFSLFSVSEHNPFMCFRFSPSFKKDGKKSMSF